MHIPYVWESPSTDPRSLREGRLSSWVRWVWWFVMVSVAWWTTAAKLLGRLLEGRPNFLLYFLHGNAIFSLTQFTGQHCRSSLERKNENSNVGSVQTKKYGDLSRARGGTLTDDELSFLNGKVVILLFIPQLEDVAAPVRLSLTSLRHQVILELTQYC
jgi:hypothetical protein